MLPQKKSTQHERHTQKRHDGKKQSVTKASGIDAAKDYVGELPVLIIRRQRVDPEAALLSGKVLDAKDQRFTASDWNHINGANGSAIYVVVDSSTDAVHLVVKISLFRDLRDSRARTEYESIADHMVHDSKLHAAININGSMKSDRAQDFTAKTHGKMWGMGYRAGMEQLTSASGVNVPANYGEYTKPGNVTWDDWQRLRDNDMQIHSLLGQKFSHLAPRLFDDFQALTSDMPKWGTEASKVGGAIPQLFTPNITYTYGGFANRFHCDRDVNTMAFGVFMPLNHNLKLTSRRDGYRQYSGTFCLASYKVVVDFANIDGVVEQIWRGGDVHATTIGTWRGANTHLGSSCQLNKMLYQRVIRGLDTPVLTTKLRRELADDSRVGKRSSKRVCRE